jgi:hypothetical protein
MVPARDADGIVRQDFGIEGETRRWPRRILEYPNLDLEPNQCGVPKHEEKWLSMGRAFDLRPRTLFSGLSERDDNFHIVPPASFPSLPLL